MHWKKSLVFPALGLAFLFAMSVWKLFITAGKGRTNTVELETAEATSPPPESINEGIFLDSSVEGELPAAFKAALKNYSVVPPSEVKIVFVLTYYRAGAPLLNDLLSADNRTFLYFEPLGLFTVSGRVRAGREHHAFRLIEELMACRIENVPLYTVWLEGTDFYQRNRFLSNLCEGGHACTSPSHMSAVCLRSHTRVFKFSRLYVSQVSDWLKRNPGMANSIRVIHLVRDPRAVYYSRRRLKWCTSNAECDKASSLCDQMRSDIDAFDELASQLPADRAHRLRFEDLVANPLNETVRLYRKLGLNYTSAVSEYVAKRKSPKLTPDRFKKKLSKTTLISVEDACYDVLEELGYDFLLPQVEEAELE